MFVPHDYDGKTEVPVILFLHGAGETKGGKQEPMAVGIGTAIKKQEKTFPAIVVIPQSEKRTWRADEDFYRGQGSESARGSGLGLALCRRVMALHDGTIAIQQSDHSGTLFRLWFPPPPRPPAS